MERGLARAMVPRRAWSVGLRLWLATVVLFALGAGLLHGDASQRAGLASWPRFESAAWSVRLSDATAFWQALAETDLAVAASEELALVLHEGPLFVRQRTGIRPTPDRLAFWLGRQLLVLGDGRGEWGVLARPRLPLRLALALAPEALESRGDAVRLGSAFVRALEEDWVAMASSPNYLDSLARDVQVDSATTVPRLTPTQAAIDVAGPDTMGSLRIALDARGTLPFDVELAADTPANETPIDFAETPWPDSPIATFTAQTPGQLVGPVASLGALATDYLGVPAESVVAIATESRRIAEAIEADPAVGGPISLALYDVEMAGPIPIPDLAVRLLARDSAGTSPALALPGVLPAEPRLEHAWDDTEGVVIPIWGQRVTLAVVRNTPHWYVATNEPRMARLAHAFQPGSTAPLRAESRIHPVAAIDWAGASRATIAAMRAWSSEGLTPPYSERDLQPYFSMLAAFADRLGRFRLERHIVETSPVLRFAYRGFVNAPIAPPSE